jgi:hypothetical protein
MFIEVTNESGRAFLQRGITGPVTMLNLLRFRSEADYSAFPDLAPEEPITGRQAYDLYVTHTLPFLATAGGSLTFAGAGGNYLIGPMDERWDVVMLVRYPSVQAFMGMADNSAYLAGIGHRTAALEDSRLLPIDESDLHWT